MFTDPEERTRPARAKVLELDHLSISQVIARLESRIFALYILSAVSENHGADLYQNTNANSNAMTNDSWRSGTHH